MSTIEMNVISRLGERLRKEREREGLTQEELAKRVGITRRSQVNYEAGKRVPDAKYLLAIAGRGLDVEYVLTGKSAAWERTALEKVLSELEKRLGIVHGFLFDVVTTVWEEEVKRARGMAVDDAVVTRMVERLLRVFRAALGKQETDTALLAAVIEGIEKSLQKYGKALSVTKKAQVVVMLYQLFREREEEADQDLIDDVVCLAAT